MQCSVCVCDDDGVGGDDGDDVDVDHGVFSKSHLQIIQRLNTLTGDTNYDQLSLTDLLDNMFFQLHLGNLC